MIGKSLAFDACYLAAAVPPPYHSLKCMELLQACNFDLHCFKTIIDLDALEANMEFKLNSVPSYPQQDKEGSPWIPKPAVGFFDLENGNRRSRLTLSTSTSTLQCDAADGGRTPSGAAWSWSP